MTFTLLDTSGGNQDATIDTISLPGAETLPVGSTQVALAGTYRSGSLTLPGGGFQHTEIPSRYTNNAWVSVRHIKADSPPVSITGFWVATFAVRETIDLVGLEDKPMHFMQTSSAGDILVMYKAIYSTLSYAGNGNVPAGFTTLRTVSGRYYPYQVSYREIESDTPFQINNQNQTGINAMLTFRAAESQGISFQIKHNGALIPATPHLWSGGQLAPVALSRPE